MRATRRRAKGAAQGVGIRAADRRGGAAAGARDARTGRSEQTRCRIWRPQAHRTGRRRGFQIYGRQCPAAARKAERRGDLVQGRGRAEAGLSRRAQLGLARLLAADNKIDEASRLIDAVIAAHPKVAEAYALQADLRLFRGDRAGAKTSLEQAVAADGSFMPARYALIQF